MKLPDRDQIDMWDAVTLAPKEEPPPRPAKPAHVSAGRQLRALQASLPVVRDADPDPEGLDGWRDYLGAPMPQIVAGVCSELAERRRPDGTLSPCLRVRCPHHLALHLGETVEVGPVREAEIVISTAGLPVEMGRRSALPSLPETHGEVEAFQLAAVEALDRLPDTCELDVIARHPDGATIPVIAEALGVSDEVVRLTFLSAAEKVDLDDLDPPPPELADEPTAVVEAPPVRIVRIERDAPPPREACADEIFTF